MDPTYVKAWARKGDIEMLLKENHKAMDSYRKGLSLDPDNAACKEGLRKVASTMGSRMSEEEQRERAAHAMADPEIQAILNDPVMRQILNDFNENPAAARKAMADPAIARQLEN
jgi:stress-induced-phosphoprotein 1